MGFWQRLFGREERAEVNAETAETDGSTQSAMLLSLLVGNEEINADTAQEIPAFTASVDFIADTIAALPVKLYREDTKSRTVEEITEDKRLVLLNDETGDLMGAFDAKRAQIRDMLIYGAGYMYIAKNGAAAQSLHYVRSRDVYVQKNTDPIFKDADIRIQGRRFYPWDFIIVTRNSTDGVTGRGMVEEIKTLLSATYNTLKYENVISRTGGNKKGFLQSERKLDKNALDNLRRAWQDLYANNGNNMMVLNDGVKYVASASTSVEMQLNQNKVTNAAQIAQGFGLSIEVISGTANTEQYMSAVRRAVLPKIKEYEAALNRSLLLESEKRTMYFALDTTELMKGDVLSRYRAYAVGLQNNLLRLDEVRYKEDLEPLGFNYMKLGLQDVLLDPETGDIYTPNTNAAVNLSNMGQIKAQGLTDGEKIGNQEDTPTE